MIQSKADYRSYLEADLRAAKLDRWRWSMFLSHPTVHFTRVLRRVEYLDAGNASPLAQAVALPVRVYFRLLSIYLGFTIPPHTCGPGLRINHWGTIVISPAARLGARAHLNVCINVGLKDGRAPTIGNDCYIGPGAMLFGGIELGDRVRIGANSVVNKDFPDGVTIAGVPARDLKEGNQ